jgi:hypothetical protein
MDGDAWIPTPKPSEYGRQQPNDGSLMASDPNLAERRVAEKLDILHPLTQIIEHGRRAVKQRATMDGRLHTLLASIQETHADRAF